jgi:hypothetical protein
MNGTAYDYGQLQRTYPVIAARICCYTPQHNCVIFATKHDLEDSTLRRRNYPKAQGYLRCFNHLLIQRLQDKVADPKKIDVLEVMHIAVAAWSMDVKLETICNCFRHCRICTTDANVTPVPEELLIDLEVIKDLEEQVQQLRY